MYPNRPEMDFDCGCPILDRKNVWNDVTGVHVRYCPLCGERREQFYEPTVKWSDTGRGAEPEPKHITDARVKAGLLRGTVRNPKAV